MSSRPLPSKKSSASPATTTKSTPRPDASGAGSDIFARWKAGTRISELVTEFKQSRPQIRKQLLLGAGSREAFAALRKQGAGGLVAQRGKPPETKPRVEKTP